MNGLRLLMVFSLIFVSLCPLNCFKAEKFAEEMAPVMQAAAALKQFHTESHRLPNDDDELLTFCNEKDISLDLSKFSKLTYHLSSDSTITLDYELNSSNITKGSFDIDIK